MKLKKWRILFSYTELSHSESEGGEEVIFFDYRVPQRGTKMKMKETSSTILFYQKIASEAIFFLYQHFKNFLS